MSSLYNLIIKTAQNFSKVFVRDRIACLPKILDAIIEKQGGRTKY
jgi:hypothetical protein